MGDGYAVRIQADFTGNEDNYLFEVEFEELFREINTRKDLLVSLGSLYELLSDDENESIQSANSEAIQSANAEYISKHGKLQIEKSYMSDDGVMFFLKCGKYEEALQLTPDQIMKMTVKP